jgi:hypothetical protein
MFVSSVFAKIVNIHLPAGAARSNVAVVEG